MRAIVTSLRPNNVHASAGGHLTHDWRGKFTALVHHARQSKHEDDAEEWLHQLCGQPAQSRRIFHQLDECTLLTLCCPTSLHHVDARAAFQRRRDLRRVGKDGGE